MQSPCIDTLKTRSTALTPQQFLGFHHSLPSSPPFLSLSSLRKPRPRVSCSFKGGRNRSPNREIAKVKGKDNVWSVDNDVVVKANSKERGGQRRKKKKGRSVKNATKKGHDGSVMVSGSMLMEVEDVLQIQEPVIRPAWNTFASSISGIWKGVGAVFSPITAQMEPIEVGKKNEHLFDCYTLSRIEAVSSSSGGQKSQIHRRVNWVTLNPYGERQQLNRGGNIIRDVSIHEDASTKEIFDESMRSHNLPKYESFDFKTSDVMEDDVMGMEPGLVFFEDGSYSRGPVDIPVGEVTDSNYYLSPTYKFEQCLVKGCHKRLRIVHTIEFSNGGSDIQILRVAVYEEKWVSTANLPDDSDLEFDLKPFSQRKRVQPSELTGSWKVFEVSGTPIYGEDSVTEESNSTPYVYLCTETLKKRNLPENPVYFGEEDMLDMADVTALWLPGGLTGYVDVNKDGVLCIGVGWYSDEGINLIMERDYGSDGKLKEVRSKSEVKRRWSDPL